jgi:hypothetical protein
MGFLQWGLDVANQMERQARGVPSVRAGPNGQDNTGGRARRMEPDFFQISLEIKNK